MAKAHNLSFGNLQSLPSSSSWPSAEVEASFSQGGIASVIQRKNIANKRNHLGSDEFQAQGFNRSPPELLHIKQEDVNGKDFS